MKDKARAQLRRPLTIKSFAELSRYSSALYLEKGRASGDAIEKRTRYKERGNKALAQKGP